MADAQRGHFDLILTESLDRLSRDQEDIAGLYKRMCFAGVGIVTLSEGDISELHIGLKGTMGALYLKELAEKTRRGMRGRVELGKAGSLQKQAMSNVGHEPSMKQKQASFAAFFATT